jgi:tetratricopeptide (TPR) repeat protein
MLLKPSRPWFAVCVDPGSGKLALEWSGSSQEPGAAHKALFDLAADLNLRPGCVEICDPELAAALDPLLAAAGIGAVLRPEIAGLTALYERALQGQDLDLDTRSSPGLAAAPGVTPEGIAGYARAAARFFAAGTWKLLLPGEWINIESPDAGSCFGAVTLDAREGEVVFGGPVQDDDAFDFGEDEVEVEVDPPASEEPEDFMEDDIEGWGVAFVDAALAPEGERELWHRLGLPWSGEGKIPWAARFAEVIERPDGEQLAFLEGVLTALAATTESDLAAGSWEHTVETHRGPQRFAFRFPAPAEDDLESEDLEEEDGVEPADLSAEAEAEILADRAFQTLGFRRSLLARKALEAWPDCALAYAALGGLAPDPGSARALFEEGLAALERGSQDGGGAARARNAQGLVAALWREGKREEAIERGTALLRDHPDLDQLRLQLADLLLEAGRYDDVDELLGDAEDLEWPALAWWLVPRRTAVRTLVAFRREGDSAAARAHLEEAFVKAPTLVRFLRGTLPLPNLELPDWTAVDPPAVLLSIFRAWAGTPGALAWLEERSAARARRSPAGKSRKRGRKKERRPKTKKKKRRR